MRVGNLPAPGAAVDRAHGAAVVCDASHVQVLLLALYLPLSAVRCRPVRGGAELLLLQYDASVQACMAGGTHKRQGSRLPCGSTRRRPPHLLLLAAPCAPIHHVLRSPRIISHHRRQCAASQAVAPLPSCAPPPPSSLTFTHGMFANRHGMFAELLATSHASAVGGESPHSSMMPAASTPAAANRARRAFSYRDESPARPSPSSGELRAGRGFRR